VDNFGAKRTKAYVWVTWITGLLAGTDKCQFRAWIKANHKVPKKVELPEDRERLGEYLKIHTQMVEDRVQKLKKEGMIVRVEDDNAFKLDGEKATLAGKQDIIALHPSEQSALVVDEKSGKEKECYVWQVVVYMFAMMLTGYKGYRIRGEVEYRNKTVPVPESSLSQANTDRIISVMNIMGQDIAPPTVPSAGECQYCDVLACPDRFKVTTDASKFF
jgi:CRISPR/Cas system-associated exonuclease Cas4 (RecB family)